MKGIVFNLLEELVRRDYGENTWDALLESAALEGAYTSLGSYRDEELIMLVSEASRILHKTVGSDFMLVRTKCDAVAGRKIPGILHSSDLYSALSSNS
jgi:hypothetical protein